MVDVAAIFDEIFGPDDPGKGVPEKKCVLGVSVSDPPKSLRGLDIPDTKTGDARHTFEKKVSGQNEKSVRDIEENQGVKGRRHKNTKTHLKMDTPLSPVDHDAFEERAALIEHDGGLPRLEAETLAAREQGYDIVDSLHLELVDRWAVEIDRLATLPTVSPEGAEALKRARAFIAEGWALQAARLGWDEVELFGVCPCAPWQRLDRKGAAFGGAVQAVTAEAITYVGGLRRYRAIINNDGGAVPIWELTGGAIKCQKNPERKSPSRMSQHRVSALTAGICADLRIGEW